MKRKKKFIIGGAVLFIALSVLLVRGFVGGATYYYEVGEFLALGNTASDDAVRVNGVVAPGSVEQTEQGRALKFVVTDVKDNSKSLAIYYKGVVPDSFKVGNEVVSDGKLGADGVFYATALMPKCPSKYKPVG
ncbi:MAG: hypothetical protein A2137_04120 [Chloroflexi bacterium RBG_16_58_8]|nr:MAG: hypothetical protein A2137_04120 [Chloroflexi bacterium RBG_16_58_8]